MRCQIIPSISTGLPMSSEVIRHRLTNKLMYLGEGLPACGHHLPAQILMANLLSE